MTFPKELFWFFNCSVLYFFFQFCQPGGWYLSKEKEPVTFFVSVLTDDVGKQQYCAVLSFSEPLRTHSPSHTNRTLTKGRTKSTDGDAGVVENGFPSDYPHGDDYIDEDMCRVENEDTGYVSEPTVSGDAKKDFKYAPKCLVLLSRIQDFKILKVSFAGLPTACSHALYRVRVY